VHPRRDTGRPSPQPRRGGGPVGAVFLIGPHVRHVLERLTILGLLGILAVAASAPVTIHTGVAERVRGVVAAGHHRLHVLVAHGRYNAAHVGGGSVSFTFMIVAELLGTLLAITVIVWWADRRAGNRAVARTPGRTGGPDGPRP
jgi:hypothetical protein